MIQRNSLERATMLAERATEQRARFPSRWRFSPSKLMRVAILTPHVIPAWFNRRTGKPHEHNRVKTRRLTQLACRRIHAWGDAWAKLKARPGSPA